MDRSALAQLAAPWARVTQGPNLAIGLVVLVFMGRGLPFLEFVPLWDGRLYTECLLEAVAARSPGQLNCFEHISIAYMALLALPQLLAPGSYPLILGVNLLLGAGALLVFYRVLLCLFPERERRIELVLLSAILSACPVFLSSAINPNPDYGVFVFLLLCVWAMLRGNDGATVLAGAALVFSKEPGFIFYLLAVGLHGCRIILTAGRTWTGKLLSLTGKLQLLIPPVLFVLFAVSRSWFTDSAHVWIAPAASGDPTRVPLAYLLGIFLLQFHWVLALVLAAWLVSSALDHCFRLGMLERVPQNPGAGFIVALFALATLALTAPLVLLPTAFNPRYILPLAPLFFIVSYTAMLFLIRASIVRQSLLAGVAVLFLASNFRTLDPVSKHIYGTFAFGEHSLLALTSVSGDCCESGRDQLAYNLEFTEFHYLQNRIYADLKPSPETLLVAHWFASDWCHASVRLDTQTFSRTLRREGSFLVRLRDPAELQGLWPRPEGAFFIGFPNLQVEPPIGDYDIVSTKTYERSGYAITVHELRLTEPPRLQGSLVPPARDPCGA